MTDPLTAVRRVFLLATFLRWLGTGLTTPVLVLLLTTRGIDLRGVGVAFAVYGLTTTVSELPTGGLADVLGRRPVLAAAAIGFMAFDIGLLGGRDLTGFVIAAAAGGLGRALASGPLESWFVDRARTITPDLVLRPDLSRAGTVKGIALTAGALSSTVVTTLAGPSGWGGFELAALPIAGALVADLLLFIVVVVAVREDRTTMGRDALDRAVRGIPFVIVGGSRLAWSTPMVRRVLATNGAIGLAVVTIELFWQPRLADLVGSTARASQVAGLVVASYMMASSLGATMARHLPTRMADRPGPAAGGVLAAAATCMVGLALAPSGTWLAVALMVIFGLIALSGVLRQELLHEWVPSSRRATMVSISSLVSQSGNVVASLAIAPLAVAAGIPVGWIVGGAVLATGAMVISAASLPARTPAPSDRGVGWRDRPDTSQGT